MYWRLLAPLVEQEAAGGVLPRVAQLLASATFHRALLAVACQLVVASRRQVPPPLPPAPATASFGAPTSLLAQLRDQKV